MAKLTSLAVGVLLACLAAVPGAGAAPINDDFSSHYYPHWWWSAWPDSNAGATKEPGEPDHAGNAGGHSVWYVDTAYGPRRIAVNTCGSTIDTLLGMYTGADVAHLTTLDSSDDSDQCGPGATGGVVSAYLQDRTDYYVAIDGKNGGSGDFTLEYVLNDDFSRPGSLGDGVLSDDRLKVGATIGATKEPGEPPHAGDAGGRSVWYRLVPRSSTWIELDTCDATYAHMDTLLAVYTGGAPNALAPVASNDDTPGCGPGGQGSRLVFFGGAGTDYRVAVDGKGGAAGRFFLQAKEAASSGRQVQRQGGPGLAGFSGTSAGVKMSARAITATRKAFVVPVKNENGFVVVGTVVGEIRGVLAARRSILTLGKARFSAAPHRTTRVTVRMKAKAKRLLRRQHRLTIRIRLSLRDPRGATRTVSRKVLLRAPRRRR